MVCFPYSSNENQTTLIDNIKWKDHMNKCSNYYTKQQNIGKNGYPAKPVTEMWPIRPLTN